MSKHVVCLASVQQVNFNSAIYFDTIHFYVTTSKGCLNYNPNLKSGFLSNSIVELQVNFWPSNLQLKTTLMCVSKEEREVLFLSIAPC